MRRAAAVCAALAAALAAVEWALDASAHGPAGTSAAAGLVGCVAIVVTAKWLGKAWLQRRAPGEDADE